MRDQENVNETSSDLNSSNPGLSPVNRPPEGQSTGESLITPQDSPVQDGLPSEILAAVPAAGETDAVVNDPPNASERSDSGPPFGLVEAIPSAEQIAESSKDFELQRTELNTHLTALRDLFSSGGDQKWQIGDELQYISIENTSLRQLAKLHNISRAMLSEMQIVSKAFPPRDRIPPAVVSWWQHAKAIRAISLLRRTAKALGVAVPAIEPQFALAQVEMLKFSPRGIAQALARTHAPELLDSRMELRETKETPAIEIAKNMLPMFVIQPGIFGRPDYWGVVVAATEAAALKIIGGNVPAKSTIQLLRVGALAVKPGQYVVRSLGRLITESEAHAMSDTTQDGSSPVEIVLDVAPEPPEEPKSEGGAAITW